VCQVAPARRNGISLENIDSPKKSDRGIGERVETIDQKVELQNCLVCQNEPYNETYAEQITRSHRGGRTRAITVRFSATSFDSAAAVPYVFF